MNKKLTMIKGSIGGGGGEWAQSLVVRHRALEEEVEEK